LLFFIFCKLTTYTYTEIAFFTLFFVISVQARECCDIDRHTVNVVASNSWTGLDYTTSANFATICLTYSVLKIRMEQSTVLSHTVCLIVDDNWHRHFRT